jgi:3',5'-cyclic AMP phosphodiesterase CpdA
MTRIALLADLHFGSVPDGLAELLLEDVTEARPDVVAIAGDLTMAATEEEFEAARNWLSRLPCAKLVVPGNHDVPKYNLFARFLWPYARYHRFIEPHERGPVATDGCHIVGLNTTSSWQPHLRWEEGRVRRRDVVSFVTSMEQVPRSKYRVVVAHHPFAHVPEIARIRPVRRARSMLEAFSKMDVDLVLSGHIHQSYVLPVNHQGNDLVAVGAPTALSNRQRGEANGYWLIDLDEERIVLIRKLREGVAFIAGEPRIFAGRDGSRVELISSSRSG